MAVAQPTDRLMDLDRALVARQRADWARIAGASAAAGGVGASEGPTAGITMGQKLLASGEKGQLTETAKMELKKDVASAMAKYAKDMADTKLDALTKLNKRDEMFKAILEASMKAHGADVGAMSEAGKSFNQAQVELNRNWSGALVDIVKEQSPGNAAQIGEAFNNILSSMAGSPAGPDRATADLIMRTLVDMRSSGNDAGAEALIMKLEMAAPTYGIQSFNGWLEQAAQTQGGAATTAYSLLQEVGRSMEHNNAALLEAAKADKDATYASLKMMIPNQGRALETATSFMEKFGDITDPAELTKAINDTLGPDAKQDQPLEPFMKLLDEIDKESIPAASTFAEARRRFIADPEFQQWMKDNGFKPGSESVALHELHRLAKERVHKASQDARELIGSRVRGGVGPGSGLPPSPSAAVVGTPGSAASAKASKPAYEPGWVLDEEFTPWFYGEDGTLRQPTPAELDQLDKDIETAGGGDKGLKAVVRPASEFASLKSASDKVRSAGLISEARQKASEVALPGQQPTLGSTINAAGYGLANPRAGLQMLKNEFKKKKPVPPPILEEMQAQVP